MGFLTISKAAFRFSGYTEQMLFISQSVGSLRLVILVVLITGCATAPPTRTENICSIYEQKRGWHGVASRAEKKWGTSMHVAMSIMNQESAFKSRARPPRRYLLGFIPWHRPTTAFGYAQAIDGTWSQYLKATGNYSRKRSSFTDATDFVHWYMGEAIRRNKVAKGDAYNLYLNYHEGTGGFRRGTFKKKKWLHSVALKVQRRSENYRAQYASCKDSFKPGFWGRLFGY